MKRLVALACGMLMCTVASADDLPRKFVGVWATADSSFDGEFFLGGLAVYIDKNGNGILLGGPKPPACADVSCARPAGMFFHASIGKDGNDIVATSRDMAGKTVSGTGWTYDPATDTLRSNMMETRGTRLSHRAVSVSPDVMSTYLDQLHGLEQDIPSGFETYTVPSGAMEPTLKKNATVLVDARLYKTSTPQRGHIVAYESGKDRRVIYIHRVVAVPGDTVEVRDWTLAVNGKTVDVPYAALKKGSMSFSRNMAQVTVPEGAVFVLGDSWDNSMDSRFRGVVPQQDIMGRVFMQKPSSFEGDFTPVE